MLPNKYYHSDVWRLLAAEANASLASELGTKEFDSQQTQNSWFRQLWVFQSVRWNPRRLFIGVPDTVNLAGWHEVGLKSKRTCPLEGSYADHYTTKAIAWPRSWQSLTCILQFWFILTKVLINRTLNPNRCTFVFSHKPQYIIKKQPLKVICFKKIMCFILGGF